MMRISSIIIALCALGASSSLTDVRDAFADTVKGIQKSVTDATDEGTTDQINKTINDIHRGIESSRNRTTEAWNKTVGDIRNRTDDFKKSVDETSRSFSSYITAVFRDVIRFIKSIFGETDTPGEPAIAPPKTPTPELAETRANLSPESFIPTSSRYMEKTVYLSILSLLVYWILSMRKDKVSSIRYNEVNDSYYRNLDEIFL
jgi:hypothetical protein